MISSSICSFNYRDYVCELTFKGKCTGTCNKIVKCFVSFLSRSHQVQPVNSEIDTDKLFSETNPTIVTDFCFSASGSPLPFSRLKPSSLMPLHIFIACVTAVVMFSFSKTVIFA